MWSEHGVSPSAVLWQVFACHLCTGPSLATVGGGEGEARTGFPKGRALLDAIWFRRCFSEVTGNQGFSLRPCQSATSGVPP